MELRWPEERLHSSFEDQGHLTYIFSSSLNVTFFCLHIWVGWFGSPLHHVTTKEDMCKSYLSKVWNVTFSSSTHFKVIKLKWGYWVSPNPKWIVSMNSKACLQPPKTSRDMEQILPPSPQKEPTLGGWVNFPAWYCLHAPHNTPNETWYLVPYLNCTRGAQLGKGYCEPSCCLGNNKLYTTLFTLFSKLF